ncbi:FecCD family ABC transporter permease [Vibrio tapetis]|uniref:Iron-dicitrate transporter subunit membrane component of ABC superfamily KpLE2 phage-like element n=1 Tax=Vibrio tapetis subsp. tapetis TaxID=1671868 RepID=A0A2N8ZD36_9VIBR|nr:iron ABC transporter permease [Vibrio tapetis]SON49795.1 iron-dicitrate transporter subunit; membrane component of ABC superfamily; KpLE2 phage-like element [Vibrio tapetis subsp. tapetis]
MNSLRMPPRFVIVTLVLLSLVSGYFSLAYGSIDISSNQTLSSLLSFVHGNEPKGFEQTVVLEMRLPRVLLAALIGGLLALAGVIIQAIVRNPMADPYLLGVSNGASMVMVLLFAYGGEWLSHSFLPQLLSGLGGLSAFLLVMLLARQNQHSMNTNKLILAGIAVSFMLSAITSMIMLSAQSQKLPGIMQWMMGSLVNAQWSQLPMLTTALILGLVVAVKYSRVLDALSLGDEKAATLGVNLRFHRFMWSVLTALLTGIAVSQVGVVGFIGLMVPHFARFLVGGSHHCLLPISVLLGALLCILVDLLCRILIRPEELPIGIPMAIIAMPFFLWLLRSNHAR